MSPIIDIQRVTGGFSISPISVRAIHLTASVKQARNTNIESDGLVLDRCASHLSLDRAQDDFRAYARNCYFALFLPKVACTIRPRMSHIFTTKTCLSLWI